MTEIVIVGIACFIAGVAIGKWVEKWRTGGTMSWKEQANFWRTGAIEEWEDAIRRDQRRKRG